MSTHDLNSSNEYKYIKEKQKIVRDALNSGADPLSAIYTTLPAILKKEIYGINLSRGPQAVNTEALVAKVLRPDTIEKEIADLKHAVAQSTSCVYGVSNYAFSEAVFLDDCGKDELKKFRKSELPGEDAGHKMARMARRKAEEAYKNGYVDEAIKFFKDADEKNPFDFTVHYQLALIYFFEKGDCDEALVYFQKARKHSDKHSNSLCVRSLVLTGLMLLIKASGSNDYSIYQEAFNAITQARSMAPEDPFAVYALAQCSAGQSARAGGPFEAGAYFSELLKKSKFYALQIISDPFFSKYCEDINSFLCLAIADVKNSTNEICARIDKDIEEINGRIKYINSPQRAAALRSEYRRWQELSKNDNYFDAVCVYDELNKVLSECELLISEIEKNKTYIETRELIEIRVTEYAHEIKEIRAPLSAQEAELAQNIESLAGMDKMYPTKNAGNGEDHGDWKSGSLFWFIKNIFGCFTSLLCVVIFFCIFQVLKIEFNLFSLAISIVIFLLSPVYGAIIAETYYIIIENRRKSLSDTIAKLRAETDARRPKFEELDIKLREKYIETIADKTKIKYHIVKKMFEACIDGNPEQIKILMSSQ